MVTRQRLLITGARAPVALHLARLLADAGHEITLVDHLRYPLAANGRFKGHYHRIPAFAPDLVSAGDALSDVIRDREIDLVVPTCEEVLHLAALWALKPMRAKLMAPDFDTLQKSHNKFHFISLCKEAGLEVPKTQLLTAPKDLRPYEDRAQDWVFKPVWSRFGAQVLLCPSAKALKRIQPSKNAPWIAQEHIKGSEICAYAVARRGKLLALSAYTGLVRAGPGAAICFEPRDPETARPFVETFVRATGWEGQVSFDLMELPDGAILPLECNPRATSGLHFFTGGQPFAEALLNGSVPVAPDVSSPLAVRLAVWLYGAKMLLRPADRARLFRALRQAQDVFAWPDETIGVSAQLRSVAEFATIAARQRISLEQASTWGIEWNGGVTAQNV